MKVTRILVFATVCMVAAGGAAHAAGPVGGSETPGDPSLLVTRSVPAETVVATPPEPDKTREQPSNPKDL